MLRRRAIVSAALGIVVAFVAYAVTGAVRREPTASVTLSPSTTLHQGSAAPEHFSLARLGGGTLSLSSALHGRPAVVNFFASWCTLCREELTGFATTSRHYGTSVAFVGVDTDDPGGAAALRTLVEESGVAYPVVFDTSGYAVATAYGLGFAIPVTFILSASGKVEREFLGRVTPTALKNAVTPLLASSVRKPTN